MFLNVLFFVSLLWYSIYRWKNRALFKLAKKLHNSSLGVSLPIIDRMRAINKLGKTVTEKGGVAAFWHTHRLLILVTDAEVADFLLKTCLEKDSLMEYFTHLFGNGSIFLPVKDWRPRRRTTAPIFNQRNLERFVSVFARRSEIMADRLREAATKGAFALWPYVTAYTLDSVCESTFGVTVDTLNEKNDSFGTAFNEITKMAGDFVFRPYLHNTFMFKLLCHVTGNAKNAKIVCDFVASVIKEKQKNMKRVHNKNSTEQEHPLTQDEMTTFMELYMQSSDNGTKLTEIELREEAIVLALAALESTAIGASFTLMMLARYPDVQEKVYQELQEVFGKTSRPPEYTDLQRLKYLEAVVKESMRLYPPVPAVIRQVHKDVTLPTGVTLPKGCGILVSMEAVHRNPKYWGTDADSFKPERFLDNAPSHPAAYIPFSYGPRGCLGYKYAMMSMMTALATLLQQHRFLPPEHSPEGSKFDEASNPLRVKYNILMKEAHDFTIRLESRSVKG